MKKERSMHGDHQKMRQSEQNLCCEHKVTDHKDHSVKMVDDFKNRFLVSLILTILIIFSKNLYFLFFFSSLIFFYGGYPFLKGFLDEIKSKRPGMMTLIALSIITAYLYSSLVVFGFPGEIFFIELVTLIDIMLLGHWIEMRQVLGASRALEALAKLLPSQAHLLGSTGEIEDVLVSKLVVGNIVLVKPGEKIPSDGSVIEGETNVNEAMLTGESKPVSKKIGDKIIAGSINGEGAIKVKITHSGEDSYLSQVIKLVKEVQESKSKTQDLANRAAMWLTIIAISIGTITFLSWLYLGKDFSFSLERMVTVMVIACPHALGLAVPLVVAISTSLSVKNGLLIKDRIAFERARNINAIVFDKTGTLTKGEFGVTDIVAQERYKEGEILSYAASLESNSEHPIAKGIVRQAKDNNIEIGSVEKFMSLPGEGIQGIVDQKFIQVVGPNYLKDKGIEIENPKIDELLNQGKTVVYVLSENKIIGAIALADLIREESKKAVNKLKSMGIKCMMLTGDNKKVAKWVAKELGLDDFFAEVLPHEKSEVIKKVQSRGFKVAMVGDGINDAPALVQSDVGIAIGAGTDVAIESADIILVRNDPRDVVSVIGLAKATYKKMQQNLLWATGYNIFAIPLAAGALYNFGILLSPAIGAILMSLSTIIVAINARFLKMS